MSVLPPELMTPEQREERVAELQAEVPRQWVRFAITEWVVIWIPFFTFVALYVATDLIGDSLLVPVAIVFGIGAVGLTLYWYWFRIRPLSAEQERLEGS
jgi:hypothetical protein